MRIHPKRTYATDLTEDELTLLDVLFDGGASFHLLRRSDFSEQWNHLSHGLDDGELQTTLDRLCGNQILELVDARNRPYYRLTRTGGELWEQERTPVWERYATERYGNTTSDTPTVSVCAVSPHIRDEFWSIGSRIAMWAPASRVRFGRITNHVLIPWKVFPSVYIAVAHLTGDGWSVGWSESEFNRLRTWWRSVLELQKFV
jgi:hypothetical protein